MSCRKGRDRAACRAPFARQWPLRDAVDFCRLQEPERGPAGGFEYQRRQSEKGEEVDGIMVGITLESTANDKPAKEGTLVDKPENGAVAETLAFEAACDAYAERCGHLYVTGFAVQPDGRRQIENCERMVVKPPSKRETGR